MKKSIYLIYILILGFVANTIGQDHLHIEFTAQNNGQHVSLDSIMIINLTQGGDTMLYGSDTNLLIIPHGLNEHGPHQANSFTVSQNYPNPFIGITSIDVCIVERGDVVIRILDLSGREHASYEGLFDAGKHTFMFCPGNANFYIFSAFYDGQTSSIKIANTKSSSAKCEIKYYGFENKAGELKSYLDTIFQYLIGDNLRYIGYSKTTELILGSDVIEDIPEGYELYLFDITEGIPCVDVPTVSYQFREYNTVQIGTQCWLKENLNVGTMIPGTQPQWDNGILEKYCYDDDPANCDIYGGLYYWDEMMQYTIEPGAQGICPPGWHIPTDEEWKQLEGEVDSLYGYPDLEWDDIDYRGFDVGLRLKSKYGWIDNGNGNDSFGFSALATGAAGSGVFLNMGNYTSFWSSTEGVPSKSWYRYMQHWSSEVARYNRMQTIGRTVRCVKDE